MIVKSLTLSRDGKVYNTINQLMYAMLKEGMTVEQIKEELMKTYDFSDKEIESILRYHKIK